MADRKWYQESVVWSSWPPASMWGSCLASFLASEATMNTMADTLHAVMDWYLAHSAVAHLYLVLKNEVPTVILVRIDDDYPRRMMVIGESPPVAVDDALTTLLTQQPRIELSVLVNGRLAYGEEE